MAETIHIQLLDIYEAPTTADFRAAKQYVLTRESSARSVASLIDALLQDAAAEITRIAYKYGVKPATFTITSAYNKAMYEEITAVLDELEDAILDLLQDAALSCTADKDRKNMLLLWMLALGRGNRDLRRTLQDRLTIFMRDMEAAIAAMKLAGKSRTQATTAIKSSLNALYVSPELKAAMAHATQMQATYIRSHGVKKGNRGNSNSEANNIHRFAVITTQQVWMHNLLLNYQESGAEMYIVQRGSNYPCAICDDNVGVWPMPDTSHFPPQHGHCVCYATPVYLKNESSLYSPR